MKKQVRSCLARLQKTGESFKRFASFVLRGKWGHSKKTILLYALVALVIITIPVLIILSISHTIQPNDERKEIGGNADKVTARHPLTGKAIESPREELPRIFAVMVENSADAWPLAGIEDAFLVIEAPVEGNIPRFVTFYSEESESQKIGPVRSARPYYLDWISWFNPLYGHVGGSPEGLETLHARGIRDLDEFFQSEYFWRQKTGGRFAPHNTYTSTDLLRKALIEFPQEKASYESWKYAEGSSKGQKSVSIDWSGGTTYDVKWEYLPEENQYKRWQGTQRMISEDGDEIVIDALVIAQMDMRTVDAVGRKEVDTIGRGDAVFVQNGEVFYGQWRQEKVGERMRFYTDDGHEISLTPGKAWIEIVDSVSRVTISEEN